MASLRSYPVRIEEVHSGDDLVALFDLGIDKLFKKIRCRLSGVDTPNAYKAKPESEAGLLRDEMTQMLINGVCRAEVVAEGKGGWLINLYMKPTPAEQEICINDLLKSRGFVYQGKVNAVI